jgi:magnesium transporter
MLTRYAAKSVTWIDLVAPTVAEVKQVMQEFSLDPLIAEELLVPSYKPKVERRHDALYVILHFPALGLAGSRAEQEIDFVIGKHFLITTRYENIDPLHSFAKAFEVNTVLGHAQATHGGHVFLSMVRSLYQAMGSECDAMVRRLHEIEERIFTGRERRMVVELSQVGRAIYDFRQSLLPHREMLVSFEAVTARFFEEGFSYHVRDLFGAYERVERTLNHLRENLSELRDTNQALLTTKQNDVMQRLTVLTFLFLPLTFIASLFQMNTIYTPLIGAKGDFWIVVGAMVIVALCCFVYFKRKDWL